MGKQMPVESEGLGPIQTELDDEHGQEQVHFLEQELCVIRRIQGENCGKARLVIESKLSKHELAGLARESLDSVFEIEFFWNFLRHSGLYSQHKNCIRRLNTIEHRTEAELLRRGGPERVVQQAVSSEREYQRCLKDPICRFAVESIATAPYH